MQNKNSFKYRLVTKHNTDGWMNPIQHRHYKTLRTAQANHQHLKKTTLYHSGKIERFDAKLNQWIYVEGEE